MIDTPTTHEGGGTWSKLRRRKVVQWGIAYVAGAWGLLQGLEYVTDTFRWPDQLQQLATLAFLIGLPIVLILAWYHGDRGEQRVSRAELAILTLLFVVGGGIFWLFDRSSEPPGAASSIAEQPAAPIAAALPHEKSIAVLPFVDMSAAKDQEYMADGMAEELLNLLAKAPDLKVIARTSSFAFKGERIDIAEIARRLNVAHVLEGSVRTSGTKVRITAQLVRASDSTHLWSESYDRPLDDIFAVQDEIADAIAQTLQIRLMGGVLTRQEGGTQNLEAYQLYLQGWNSDWNTDPALDRARELLEKAIELDPDFEIAWSALASVYRIKVESGYLEATEGFERARELTQRAIQLSPKSAHAHSSLSYIYLSYDWDWAAAESEAKRALALEPTNSNALVAAARLAMTLGRWDEAERQLRVALGVDPLNPYVIYNVGANYYGSGRFAEAEVVCRELLARFPDFTWTHAMLAATLLAEGKAEAALEIVQQSRDEGSQLIMLPTVLHALGRHAEADAAQHALIDHWTDLGPFYVAEVYAYRGAHDLAMEWLERAYRQKHVALSEIVGDPLFESMIDDPRFKAFLRKMKLPEWPKQSTAVAGT